MVFGVGTARADRRSFATAADALNNPPSIFASSGQLLMQIAARGQMLEKEKGTISFIDLADSAVQLGVDLLRRVKRANLTDLMRLESLKTLLVAFDECVDPITDAMQSQSIPARTLTSISALMENREALGRKAFSGSKSRRQALVADISKHQNELDDHKELIQEFLLSVTDTESISSRTDSRTNSFIYISTPESSSGSESAYSDLAGQIPTTPAVFVGREAEFDTIIQTILNAPLNEPPRIAVNGVGGVGKTTLCLSVINDSRMVQKFQDNRLFVRCDTAATAEDMMAAIAKVLGISGATAMDQVPKVLAEMLPGVLMMLDNFETPWEGEGRRSTEYKLEQLAALPNVTLVITLRGQQRPRGTKWTEPILPPLLPFVLESARLAFTISAPQHKNDSNLDTLLSAVDCLPLAVTLLASLAQAENSLEGILARWRTEKTQFIADGSGYDRLGNLEASIQLSIDSSRMQSDPRALQLLSLISLLPNGILFSDLGTNMLGILPTALPAAAILRQTSLAYDDVPNARLRVLSPIRIYVTSRYPPPEKCLLSLHKKYASLAQTGTLIGTSAGIAALPQLLSEAENIQAIIEHTLTINQEDTDAEKVSWDSIEWAVKAAANLTDFIWYSGRCSTRSLEIAKLVSEDFKRPLHVAHCLSGIGFIASGRSENILSNNSYQAALDIYRKLDNIDGQAEALRGLGFVAIHMARYPQATDFFNEGYPLYLKAKNKWGQAQCLNGLAIAAYETKDPGQAMEKYAQALELFQAVDNLTGEGDCHRGRAFMALSVGSVEALDEAASDFEVARELFRLVGKTTGVADCQRGLGMLELARGNLNLAKPMFVKALELYTIASNNWNKAACLKGLGDVASRSGSADEGRMLYEAAKALFIQVGNRKGQSECTAAIAKLGR